MPWPQDIRRSMSGSWVALHGARSPMGAPPLCSLWPFAWAYLGPWGCWTTWLGRACRKVVVPRCNANRLEGDGVLLPLWAWCKCWIAALAPPRGPPRGPVSPCSARSRAAFLGAQDGGRDAIFRPRPACLPAWLPPPRLPPWGWPSPLRPPPRRRRGCCCRPEPRLPHAALWPPSGPCRPGCLAGPPARGDDGCCCCPRCHCLASPPP